MRQLGADLARHGLEFCHTAHSDRRAAAGRRSLGPHAWTARPTSPRFNAIAAGEGDRYRRRHRRRSSAMRRCSSACSAARCGRCADLQAARRRGLAARPARSRRVPRRGADAGARLAGDALPVRDRRARSGRRGCCMPGSARKTPSPARSPGSSPSRWKRPARRSSRAARRTLLAAFEALIRERAARSAPAPTSPRSSQSDGRATGVRLATGETIAAQQGVICSVTPTQLYERLLGGDARPRRRRGGAELSLRQGQYPDPLRAGDAAALARPRARQGRAAASDARPRRRVEGLQRGARGMLPEMPTICVGQPHALDPSRCPRGQGDPLAAASRSAAPHQGRCGGQDRRAGRRQVDRGDARSLCRPRRGDPRQPHRRLSRERASRAAPIRRPTSRR